MSNYNINAGFGNKMANALTAKTTGKTFYVQSASYPDAQIISEVFGYDTDGLGRVFNSITAAHTAMTADNGDVLYIAPGYTETITAAAGVTLSKSGIKIIGLGEGNNRPQITFSTSTAASLLISGANVSIENVIGVTGINALTKPFDVTGNDVSLSIEFRDGSASVEAASIIRATTVSRLNVNLKHKGFISGSAGVNPIQLNGVTGARVNVDFYGKASTAVVNFVTAPSTDVNVTGYFYNSGTALTKDIVDTITGSIWYTTGTDGVGGYSFSGGSASALAADDVSTINSNMAVPAPDATTNVNERDVVGNKSDAAVTTVGTTASIIAYVKGLLSTATAGVTDAVTNVFMRDVIGNKADAPVYNTTAISSIVGYIKGIINANDKSVASATATMVNGQTIFTVTGDIQVLGIVSECITGNDATASTVQYQSAPTVGAAATFTGASASLANALAGASLAVAGTSVTTAPNLVASGANFMISPASGLYVPAGTIKLVVAVGSTTGTWKHYIKYKPLELGALVS